MGDSSNLTPTHSSRQQQQIHQHQQISDSPQSELSIPTPAPRARISGEGSRSCGCNHNNYSDSDNATHSGIVNIDAMNTENVHLTPYHEQLHIVCAATRLASNGERGGRRNAILRCAPVNTIGTTERLKPATFRRGIENEENNEGERVGCVGPMADYRFSLSSPSGEQRTDIESEMLNTPHVLLRELSDAAESPQITLRTRLQEHHRRQRLTSPLPDNDNDTNTSNSVMGFQKEQQQEQQRQRNDDTICSLSIPSPLPGKEVQKHLHTSDRGDSMMTPSSNPPKEEQEQEQKTTAIICPVYDIQDFDDNDKDDNDGDDGCCQYAKPHSGDGLEKSGFSFSRSGERYTTPRRVCTSRATQSYQEVEPEIEQRGLARVYTNSSALHLNPQDMSAEIGTCEVSPNTSTPVLVDWRVVVEESIVLDVTVDNEDDEEYDSNNKKNDDNRPPLPPPPPPLTQIPPPKGEHKVSQEKTWCGTTQDVNLSLTSNHNHRHNCNDLEQLQVSMAQQSAFSWPPSVESVCETSVEGIESVKDDYAGGLHVRHPVGMRRLLDAVATTTTTTTTTTATTNGYCGGSNSTSSDSSSSNDDNNRNSDRGCPPAMMPKPSSLLKGRMRTALTIEGETRGRVVSPHHERRSESHSLHMSLVVELCRAVRPFAQRLLLLLMRESGGGASVHADTCTEVVNSILESEGIVNVRATQNLCRHIISSTTNNGGGGSSSSIINNDNNKGNEENDDVNMIQYGDFVAGIMQLGEEN